ncbi:aldehyde dehydrogenase [Novosphingobium aromaticivorans DSM 12444]|uniref:Aldehyde dehydrogenase n=1 Tax=Novosphingobium aromaticivorans (strain ATCC 700278 / DSM 12444 / CCUG 56034 / CIP 105152 / NBRC 16084 / F199) TaxID=279238 RepID=Q2G538_NOVAD|nr:aldehyde dehydrogenase family protein [Novosphingobium aromaticivorans]ABD27035.1 aldehyde dehydrogenase [Novosphingobium aromaticivorans DSM 12444]SCY48595.1 aldehyde dehydrogenase (NAD+) [Novosphingobium aromaticivorans]
MADATRFYIGGEWVAPSTSVTTDIVNPANRSVVGQVALGGPADAEAAIAAARAAFPAWSATTREHRLAVLERINAALIARADEIGDAIMAEMGAPLGLARGAQAGSGPQHFEETIRVLKDYAFETPLGTTLLQREAIGVCVLITPWNWPMNQIATKVAPALAAGCTMILKPSEVAPLDAAILAEIIDEAGLPDGVFNLVHGTGPGIGDALTGHPDVDMVSFTGSTRAGIAIAANAAPTIKRVALELGGKSANILLPDADLAKAVPASVRGCMLNTGQSCNAPTRLLVPRTTLSRVEHLAREAAEAIVVGMPTDNPHMGPVANEAQYRRVIALIEQACHEGTQLLCGGVEPPKSLEHGLFVAPTIFTDVAPDATIAREEVFGPVLAIIPYETVDEAIEIANDSPYGLSGYVWGDPDAARNVARRMRTGMVHVNGASLDSAAPFGGYRMSGNGREWGVWGLEEFLEVKSIYGGA